MSKGAIMNDTKQTEKAGQRFETPDLNLASFLYCQKFSFTGFRRLNDGRTVFMFADSPELRRAVVDYANDGPVPVRSFCNTVRDLKAITRAGTSSGAGSQTGEYGK